MKLNLIILLSIFYCTGILAHGGHMATFSYQFESGQIILEFKIEKSVLEHFDLQDECEHFETATAMCLTRYINENAFLKINHQAVAFELQSSKQDKHFFSIRMIAKSDFSNYENLTVENECFLEYDRKFENRIIIQKQASTKSYRLDRKNKKIQLIF